MKYFTYCSRILSVFENVLDRVTRAAIKGSMSSQSVVRGYIRRENNPGISKMTKGLPAIDFNPGHL